MKYTIERTYLVKHAETWIVDMPDGADEPEHMIYEHFQTFNDDLIAGGDPLGGWTSVCKSATVEQVDHNELHLEVVDRQAANVIPIGRKRDR